jgi:hypothetical protein
MHKSILLLLLLTPALQATDCMRCHQDLPVDQAELFKSLRVTQDLADNAIGIQNRGQLQNYSSNFGDMADFHVWHTEAMRWPGDASDVTHYSFGLGLIVATPDNVIESVMNSTSGIRDWTPKEGSLGSEFSGELRADDDTPYMAHSHLPETWPEDGWPGLWREEYAFVPIPGSPTRQVPGQFTSDSDTWAVFDDRNNPRGSQGIEVQQVGFSYGRPYAEDHLFWRSIIHNRSSEAIDSMYVGYYVVFRPDYDYVDQIGQLSSSDFDASYGSENDIIYIWDVNGENDGAWAGNESPMGIPALMVLETPEELGVTDFHHFQADMKPVTDEEQWAVISSQPDRLASPGLYFHSPNGRSRMDWTDPGTLSSAYGEGSRINFFVMTGPFSLAAGDSVISSCAALVAEGPVSGGEPDLSDLRQNLEDAWAQYRDYRYSGPGAPPMPELSAVALPGGARLWWQPEPSESADDFEGYRLYRSLDQGQSWGDPITDSQGRRVAWVPLATYDLVDGIEGPDPNGPTHLGRDTGLAWSFSDDGLALGLEVWYCLTAYSTGVNDDATGEYLASMENPLGRSALDQHVAVIHVHEAAGDLAPDFGLIELQSEEQICDASMQLDLLDPWNLPDTDWELVFHNPAAGDSVARFSLIRADTGDSLFSYQRIDPDDRHPIQPDPSFRLLLADVQPGSDSLGWNPESPCTFDWWMVDRSGLVNEYPEYVLGADDWRIRITDESETIPVEAFAYFYQGFDTTRYDPSLIEPPVQVNMRVERRPIDSAEWQDVSPWVMAEDLRFGFPNLETLSPMGWDLQPGGLAGSRQRVNYETYTDALVLRSDGNLPPTGELLLKTNNFDWALAASGDTLYGVPPVPDDVFTIVTRKPFREGVRVNFRTSPPARLDEPSALRVRAVPDPFIAGSAPEDRLFFHGVPARCTLRIFTLTGELVRTLEHDDATSSILEWDLRNRDRQFVAYGLYLFHVSDDRGREAEGRFMVIR